MKKIRYIVSLWGESLDEGNASYEYCDEKTHTPCVASRSAK